MLWCLMYVAFYLQRRRGFICMIAESLEFIYALKKEYRLDRNDENFFVYLGTTIDLLECNDIMNTLK